jgi:hypothetical protein
MATELHGTVDQPLEDANITTRRVAFEQGWAWNELDSSPSVLEFRKGVSAFTFGSHITVELEDASASQTRITVSSRPVAVTDFGRGHKAAEDLLQGLAAREG